MGYMGVKGREKMYKGSDGLLTTRDAFMRIIAKKRAVAARGQKRVGGTKFSGISAPGRFKRNGGA